MTRSIIVDAGVHGACTLVRMKDSQLRASLLFATAALAAAGFAFVSDSVRKRKTQRADQRVQDETREHTNSRVRTAANVTHHIGKWYAHLPYALGVAGKLMRERGSVAGAATVAGASIGSALLNNVLERVMPYQARPDQTNEDNSYPSGHAMQATAVSIASGYVLMREGMSRPWIAGPLTLASIVAPLAKLVLDQHWTSDLLGGYCAGIAIGATAAGAYELTA